MPRALITGVTGQDGWYLAGQLRDAGWEVHGIARRRRDVPPGTVLHLADATDAGAMNALVAQVAPHSIFHLAAESFVAGDAPPERVVEAHRRAVVVVLDAWQHVAPHARVVLASSSEVFGGAEGSPQDASTPLCPVTAYGRGKAEALLLLRERRASTGGHLSAAILYNHESERRDPRFLGRKVSLGVAAIATGRQSELVLGDLDAQRDWGYAPEYMTALIRMAAADTPGDYVIGTGVAHSVRQFCEHAFAAAGLDYRAFVRSDEALRRGADPRRLLADPAAAARALGWRATTPFPEMVARMVRADLAYMRGG